MTVSIATLMAKKKELDEELKAHGSEAMKAEFRAFFEANPDCLALRWRQYTPYFNDGEPCTFSVNDLTLKMKDSKEDAGDYADGFEDTFAYGDDKPRKEAEPFKSAAAGVKELAKIDDEIYLIAFGDHVKVTATREGFEVDEYSHD